MTEQEKIWMEKITEYATPYIMNGMSIDEAIRKAHDDYQSELLELVDGKTEYTEKAREYTMMKTYYTIRKQENLPLNS